MHGPDGTDYENLTKYFEVEQYKRLVYDHGGSEDRPPLFRVTAEFSEVNGKTKLDMRMSLPTPGAAEEIRKHIKKASGDSTWDRLGEYLAKQTDDKERFIINRSFEAPIEMIFKMWTDPNHFSKWLPPKGFNMSFMRAEVRPGSSSFYEMTSLDGKVKMYGRVEYLEIKRPDLLV